MIVVSDTSPLINLAWLGRLELLQSLYGQIYIPDAVWQEVVVGGKGQPGAAEVQAADWIERNVVSNLPLVQALRQDLDAGESQAIALAIETNSDLLLMDERLGRQTAEHFGLRVMGVVGVLLLAKQRGLLSAVRPELDELRRRAGFYLSNKLYFQVIKDAGEAG